MKFIPMITLLLALSLSALAQSPALIEKSKAPLITAPEPVASSIQIPGFTIPSHGVLTLAEFSIGSLSTDLIWTKTPVKLDIPKGEIEIVTKPAVIEWINFDGGRRLAGMPALSIEGQPLLASPYTKFSIRTMEGGNKGEAFLVCILQGQDNLGLQSIPIFLSKEFAQQLKDGLEAALGK